MRTTIEQLKRQGWSIRQIARALGINRRTVAKYSRGISLPLTDSKCPPPVEDARLELGRRRFKVYRLQRCPLGLNIRQAKVPVFPTIVL